MADTSPELPPERPAESAAETPAETPAERSAEAPLPQQIAAALRRAILTGALPPGAPVKERDHAAELGVSRTPLREALRLLAQEGLIELRPARSPVVAAPTLAQVLDDLAVLRVLELLGVELAVQRATPAQVAEVAALHAGMLAASDSADPVDFFDIDMRFHCAVVAASGNPSLVATHGAYLARLWRLRFLSTRQRSDRGRLLREHGEIAEGLAARDLGRMLEHAQDHLDRLEVNIRAWFAAEDAAAAAEAETRARRRRRR